MYCSNDYLRLTREYLKNMAYREQALANLKMDIGELESEVNGISVKSSSLSDMPKSQDGEASVERQYFILEEQKRQLSQLRTNSARLENHLRKLHGSMGRLPDDQQDVLRLVYLKGCTIAYAGSQLGLSERSCSRKLSTAVQTLAEMLFGACSRESIYFVKDFGVNMA